MLEPQAITIDLSRMVEGKQTILISSDQAGQAKEFFRSSSPAQVEVNLAKIMRVSIAVKPQLVGKLPDGFVLKRVSVVPEQLEVLAPPLPSGSKPYTLATTPVYLNSIQGDGSIFCKVIAPPNIQPVSGAWQDVEVVIDVEPER